MAIINTTLWDAAPGRAAEVIGHMAHAKRIHQRLGGTVRALQVQVGGTGSLRFVYALRHADMSAFADFTAATAGDAEWTMFQQTVLGSPSPSATLFSNIIARELPGLEGPFTVTGKSVSVLTQLRMNPGGMEGTLQQIGIVKGIVEKLGASMSVRQAFIAGDNTGGITVAITYADIQAFGKGTDELLADPAYAAVVAQTMAKDAPATIVSRTQAVEVPI